MRVVQRPYHARVVDHVCICCSISSVFVQTMSREIHAASFSKVSPRKLKRSPSWSALNEVIFEKQYSRSDSSFVFMLKVRLTDGALDSVNTQHIYITHQKMVLLFHLRTAISLLCSQAAGAAVPLYGCCCYVHEVLHRPPLLASSK